ncbi:MAG TPA: hypothetical protein VMD27_01405 [Candidatus Aquilonibacter sp.]|nr:hypothetical protein [Candidatus Aquilonibacter sp.]
MFDLEQSIAEWRQQMLDAGIKAPVPLEELEIHLREEIEMQMKSGLSEREIFNSAVQKIGQARVIQTEFKKVEADHKMRRTILLITGWLAAGVTLLYGTLYFSFGWDFISFHPKWDLETSTALFIILLAETGIWFLAKVSRDRTSHIVSLLVCVLLAWFALFHCLPAEQRHMTFVSSNTSGGAIVGEALTDAFNSEPPSPIWFRGGLTLLLCVPCIFWVWRARLQMNQRRNSMRESQPIHSG